MSENQQIKQGGRHGRRNGLEGNLPEAQQLLAQQGRKARAQILARRDQRGGAQAVTPRNSSLCMMRTNASSRSVPPTRASRACVVSRATTWPLLSMRSEEHTSELQSLMRISYAVFCLKKKKIIKI